MSIAIMPVPVTGKVSSASSPNANVEVSKRSGEPNSSENNFQCFLAKRLSGFAGYEQSDIQNICAKLLEIKDLQNVITSRRLNCGEVICFSERYFALFGFAPLILRNLFFRSLRWALRPRIFHASYVNASDRSNFFFEAVCVAYLQEDVWKSVLEQYIDLWKMSVGLIDLETYMSRPFITAVKRIIDGRSIYGNWMTLKNSTARIMWSTNYHRYEEQDARERVYNETGRSFTTGNMLSLYYDLRNVQITHNHLLAVVEVMLREAGSIRSRATDHSNMLQQNRLLHSQNSEVNVTDTLRTINAAGADAVRIMNLLNALLSRPQVLEIANDLSANPNQTRHAMVAQMLQQTRRNTSVPVRWGDAVPDNSADSSENSVGQHLQATPPTRRPPSPSYPPSSRTPPPPPPPPPPQAQELHLAQGASGSNTRMYVSFRLLPALSTLAAPPSEFEQLSPDSATHRGRAG